MTWTPATVDRTQRLLRAMARRRWPHNREGFREDLVQAAWVRLLQEDYDPACGVPFAAWLIPRARWAMQDCGRAQGWVRQQRFDKAPVEVASLDALAPTGDVTIAEHYLLTETPVYPDPFLGSRIRAAVLSLPRRMRRYVLARRTAGGQAQLHRTEGVNASRGSQLGLKAVRLFRDALHVRGIIV